MPIATTDQATVRRRLAHGLVLLHVVTAALGPDPATAQHPPRESDPGALRLAQTGAGDVKLEVPGVILAAPASEVAMTIALAAGSTAPPQSFVRIRGLPPTAALSEGHAIQPGAWAVPLSALKGLRLVLPTGVSGKRDVSISLVTIDGVIIAEARTALVVAAAGLIAPEPKAQTGEPAAPAPPVAQAVPAPPPKELAPPPVVVLPTQPVTVVPQAAPPPPAPAPAPKAKAAVVTPVPPALPAKPAPVLSPETRQRAESYQTRGRTLLNTGDIASARLFFQRAADEGLADAALAMGATFDQAELAKLKAHGLRPDPGEARRWYERAAELGSGEAADRLKRLGAR